MNPGLVVKLRPTGPWRIGPDSGARNRVDTVYHSDTLYAAVTGALARLGPIEEWLAATARNSVPAVCFSSCFPFLDEIGFIVPPRTVWPPTSPALLSARVRWKSARFVPLGLVPVILAGRALEEGQWRIDAASECLVPAGRSGPFRTGMRSNAAVDRLNGSAERHSTACIEFRSGAGLWAIISFADEAAAGRWMDPVKTAFRLLADSGFGGERSRGWGRAEMPEFIEGTLPEMILPAAAAIPAPEISAQEPPVPVEEPPEEKPHVEEPPVEPEKSPEEPPREEPPAEEPPKEEAAVPTAIPIAPLSVEMAPGPVEMVTVLQRNRLELKDMVAQEGVQNPGLEEANEEPGVEVAAEEPLEEASVLGPVPIMPLSAEMAEAELARVAVEPPVVAAESEPPAPAAEPHSVAGATPQPPASPEPAASDPSRDRGADLGAPAETEPSPVAKSDADEGAQSDSPAMVPPAPDPEPPPPDPDPQPEPAPPVPEPPEPDPAPVPPMPEPSPEPPYEPGPPFPEPLPAAPLSPATPAQAHWLLSLFTPGPGDSVDWSRGSYSVVARGGRIESPVRSGERKKQLPMVTEGSVLYVSAPPAGSAPDVAPDGFVHPVYRAGFALAIPLPEVR